MQLTAKEKVQDELKELTERIKSLVDFIYSEKPQQCKLSQEMCYLLREQLHLMQEYASVLTERLKIWNKPDGE